MRLTFDIVQEMELCSIRDMEYCSGIADVQQIITNFNDHIKPYSKIQIRSGNERYMSDLHQRLLNNLKRNGFIRTNPTNSSDAVAPLMLHKVTFFLILNTESGLNLAEKDRVCHMVSNCPKMSKCVLFSCIWELKLFPHFCDFVRFAPSWMICEYLDTDLLDSMMPIDQMDRFQRVSELISAIYDHIWLHSFVISDDADANADACLNFTRIQNFLTSMLVEYMNSSREKYPELKKRAHGTMMGQLLRQFIPTISKCLNKFISNAICDLPPLPVDHTFTLFQVTSRRRLGEFHGAANEHLIVVNNMLLDRLQEIVMGITLNTFMNWVEVDLSKTITLQRSVGEKAHELCLLLDDDRLKHDIVLQLQTISVKPLQIEEIVKAANICEVMDHIEDVQAGHRKEWMLEFLSRGELVLDNEECLNVLKEHANLIGLDGAQIILRYLSSVIGQEIDFVDQIIRVFIKAVATQCHDPAAIDRYISVEQPYRCLDELDHNVEDVFTDLTQFLNKSTTDPTVIATANLQPFINALLMNPKQTVRQVINMCVGDSNQITFAVTSLFKSFKETCSEFLDDVLSDLLQDAAAYESSGLEALLVLVMEENLVQVEDFIKSILFGQLTANAEARQETAVLLLINVFHGVLAKQADVALRLPADTLTPIIVGLGQISDQFRWDLLTYTETKARIVTVSVRVIECVREQLVGGQLGSKHKLWIQKKCQPMKPMTRFYFHALLPEAEPLSFRESLQRIDGPLKNDRECVLFLVKSFVRCTPQEIMWLAQDEQLQPHFIDMLSRIVKTVGAQENSNSDPQRVLEYPFSQFLKVFQEVLLPSNLDLDHLLTFIDLMPTIPVEIYEEQFFTISSISMELVSKLNSIDDPRRRMVREKIARWPNSLGKEKLLTELA